MRDAVAQSRKIFRQIYREIFRPQVNPSLPVPVRPQGWVLGVVPGTIRLSPEPLQQVAVDNLIEKILNRLPAIWTAANEVPVSLQSYGILSETCQRVPIITTARALGFFATLWKWP
jgi:hypothetical protein